MVFYDLAKAMINLGHLVHIICLRKRTHIETTKYASLEGAAIHSVNPIVDDIGGVLLTYRQHSSYILNALLKGASVIRQENIDIVHANTLTPVIPASLLASVFRIPLVVTVHDVYLREWGNWSMQPNVSRSTSFIGPIYEKLIFKMRKNMVHVVSNATKRDFLRFNRNAPVTTVYNGMDLDSILGVNIKIEYKKFILYIGRLIVTKNLEVVILALKDVITEIPDTQMIVVGEGPMRKEWEQLVNRNGLRENVKFLGFVSQEIKHTLLSKCSALVFPSILEGFGLVIIEAFAMFKPVLVSNVSPFDELVEHSRDGFLLPPHDPSKWSEKINYLLKNDEECIKMGERGHRKANERFSLNVMGANMQKLYLSLASAPYK